MGETLRTPDLVDAIVDGISHGITLRELCRRHGIGKSTVYGWINSDPELAGRIARARDLGFDEIAEETLEIADDARNDWVKRQRQDGSVDEVIDTEHIQRSKLRIETRLKLLAKWDPKRYGEKTLIGSDPENPLPTPAMLDASKLSTETLRELMAARNAADPR